MANVFASLGLLLLLGAAPPPVHRAVKARAMLDVQAGRMVDHPVVLITGDRITAVGPGLAIPDGYEVIDLGAATILPGLIDAHTHLTTTYKYLLYGGSMHDAVTAASRAKVTLDAGVTTVRDLWAKDFTDVALRDAIERGDVPARDAGRRRSRSARPAGTTRTTRASPRRSASAASPGSRTESTACGSSSATRSSTAPTSSRSWRPRRGAKATTRRSRRSTRRRSSRRSSTRRTGLGKKVAAHAHGTDGIKSAVRAGVDSIEHGRCSTTRRSA
jgi:imidazolonepropionase-like amidohydrolase